MNLEDYDRGHNYPLEHLGLRPEPRVRAPWPRTLPRWARVTLRVGIALAVVYVLLVWGAAIVGGTL